MKENKRYVERDGQKETDIISWLWENAQVSEGNFMFVSLTGTHILIQITEMEQALLFQFQRFRNQCVERVKNLHKNPLASNFQNWGSNPGFLMIKLIVLGL